MAIDKVVSKIKNGASHEDRKHEINLDLIGIIKFRQARKWYISIAVVTLFAVILALMIYFMSNGVDVQGGWKEILLLTISSTYLNQSFQHLCSIWIYISSLYIRPK